MNTTNPFYRLEVRDWSSSNSPRNAAKALPYCAARATPYGVVAHAHDAITTDPGLSMVQCAVATRTDASHQIFDDANGRIIFPVRHRPQITRGSQALGSAEFALLGIALGAKKSLKNHGKLGLLGASLS